MKRTNPFLAWSLRLAALGLVCGLAAPLLQAEEEAPAPELPLKRVLLFSSGVGYFEHRTEVEGDVQLELKFNVDDVNDLLKSMVVQDLGGGRVSTVTYGSRDPVSKALKSFAVDMASNVTLATLLEQLRGEAVRVETPSATTGTIVSVETRKQRVKDEILETSYLNLLTTEGIRSYAFDSLRSVRLLDERLDQEMRKALEILSSGRDEKKKTVSLEFLGEGKRPIRVGYIQETPVWKTSYRLVLSDDKLPFLQGWAIVENTTDRDWENVELTLVSGRPISYTMNLYQALYAHRPEVAPPMQSGVRPQTYDRDLEERQRASDNEDKASAAPRRSSSDRRRRGGRSPAEGGAMRPGAPPAPEADSFDVQRGVETAATSAEVGELFQYRIAAPVTLPRRQSAMLPILNTDVQGEKVSIYDPAVHAKHPLNGIHLVNSTDLHVMQGPATVFDDGAYAGDALIGDMPPGAKRLLSYAMDLQVEVARENRSKPDELVSVQIAKGTLLTRHLRRRENAYVAKNSATKPKKLLIGQRLDPNWELVAPKEVYEKTRNQYRFAVDLKAGETARLTVREEQTQRQSISLSNLRADRVLLYLRAPRVSSRVKEALQDLVRRKQALDALGVQYRNLGQEIKAITQEQDRIRKNMEQIDRTSDLYVRYLEKFSKQEDRIEELRKRMAQLNLEIQAKQASINQWLLGLTLD